MRLWHTAAATSAQFDDPNLVSHAGLVPVMRLAQDCGLAELVAEQVTVVLPAGNNVPEAGEHVTGSAPSYGSVALAAYVTGTPAVPVTPLGRVSVGVRSGCSPSPTNSKKLRFAM